MIINEHNGRYTYVNTITVEGEELLTKEIFDETYTDPYAKKMTIAVNKDCVVLINNIDRVLIKPNLGLSIEYADRGIYSLIAETSDVEFYSVIAY